ncbi:MAG: hypothetical protein ACLRRY_09760 [Bifidobacterium breve]
MCPPTLRQPLKQPILTLVPYYSWANREVGQMRVWLRR